MTTVWLFLSGFACGAVLVAGFAIALRPDVDQAKPDKGSNDNYPDEYRPLRERGL